MSEPISTLPFPALLERLTQQPGLAGHEDGIARLMAEEFAAYAGQVTIDALGNVIARFGAASASPSIAILAHMDTVGFLVKTANADGMLGVVQVGGVNLRALPGTAVRLGETIPGVIGVRAQHLARAGEPPVDMDNIYVQVDPAHANQIAITTPVTYAPQTVQLGDLYSSPYLDNRAGCAVVLAIAQWLAENPPSGTVYLIGTVQEETTCMGAYHALQTVSPDVAIFVDGTLSYDTPDTRGSGAVYLGGGPVLTAFLYVSGLNGWHAHPELREHLKTIAGDRQIPIQHDAIRGLMSDARVATQLGIPSALVGIPMRGKHAPIETLHVDDLAQTFQLLSTMLQQPLPNLSRG